MQVLRHGVLYFLRDPADPNYNPFRDLIDDPVHKHARRVLLSVAVYGSLIVMLVFLPVKLAMRVAPSIFPLDISYDTICFSGIYYLSVCEVLIPDITFIFLKYLQGVRSIH